MRVTNLMMSTQAMNDLDQLRSKLMQAQGAVDGHALERPSDDPIRVVEAMNLSGAKMRIERSQRTAQDVNDWLSIVGTGVSSMLDGLQAARELAVQAGSPASNDPSAREAMAVQLESIRSTLIQRMNTTHEDQYLFAGTKTGAAPFSVAADGAAAYAGNNDSIQREVAPGLSVQMNITGPSLLAKGDFIKTLSDMAASLRAGDTETVTTAQLTQLTDEIGNLTVVQSDVGLRQNQCEQYGQYAQDAAVQVDSRLSNIADGDVAKAITNFNMIQSAYQAALLSFSKALPGSLLDYLSR